MAQEVLLAWLLSDASKPLDTAKETICWAIPTPAGVGLAGGRISFPN